MYLGSKIHCNDETKVGVKHSIVITPAAFSSLYSLWNDNRVPLAIKLRLYKTTVCSTMARVCKAWGFTDEVRNSAKGLNSRCLHVITKRSLTIT